MSRSEEFQAGQGQTGTPTITESRNAYGTTSVYTEDHHVQDGNRTLLVNQYNWHNGDPEPRYIEARGRVLKKDGTPGKQHGYTLKTPPEHVLAEMRRLRG